MGCGGSKPDDEPPPPPEPEVEASTPVAPPHPAAQPHPAASGERFGTGKQERSANSEGDEIPEAYFVEGAAIPQANGIYARDGTYSGAPLYKNGQLWLLRYTIGESRFWYIADRDTLDRDDGDLYRVKCPEGLPPRSGWGLAKDGVAPAPTFTPLFGDGPAGYLVQGAGVPAADGVYQRDGSYASAPLYKQDGGEYWMLNYVMPKGGRWWYIAHKDQLDKDEGDLYRVKSDADLPPTCDWVLARDGVHPIPHIQPFYPQPDAPPPPPPPPPEAVTATPVVMAEVVIAQPVPTMAFGGVAMPGFVVAAVPMGTPSGGWANSAAQPTLAKIAQKLKDELGLSGPIATVVDQACLQLDVPVQGSVIEKAKACYDALGAPVEA